MPRSGMMLHQDASTHRWFGDYACDLVITLDDATSEITSGFFCEQGGHHNHGGCKRISQKDIHTKIQPDIRRQAGRYGNSIPNPKRHQSGRHPMPQKRKNSQKR
jgi:hypothetical protein